MRIGIIGAGQIGSNLARKLSATGHSVFVANSREPDTIRAIADEAGASAVTVAEVVKDVDIVIIAIPERKIRPSMPSGIPFVVRLWASIVLKAFTGFLNSLANYS